MTTTCKKPVRTAIFTAAAVLLTAAGAITTLNALDHPGGSSPIPSQAATPGSELQSGQGPGQTGTLTSPDRGSSQASTGSWLVVPALGVLAPLTPTGAVGPVDDASLAVPENIHEVGWWDGTVTDGPTIVHEQAPEPGQPGVAIIAGHVDSATAGAGALYRLRDLNVGDSIRVDLQGHSSDWRVSSEPEMTAKTQLPRSLFDRSGGPRLALVTCGGPFDAVTGHYVDNVIVWAAPVQLS